MPNLSIKNVPEAIVQKLRDRAARNHRSLQGELMVLVCEAADQPVGAVERPRGSARGGMRKTIEQIAAEHRARWTEPFDEGPKAVEVIRADRDAR